MRWQPALILCTLACDPAPAEIELTGDPTTTTGGATSNTTGSATGTTGTATGGNTSGTSTVSRVYDLTGSRLFIDADITTFTITVQEPYDADDTMGPGQVILTLTADASGNPVNGPVQMTFFELTQDFVTGLAGFAEVTTDLYNVGDLGGAAVAIGTLSGNSLTWSGELDPYCQTGTVSCSGLFCGSSGAPAEDSPLVFDDDCSTLPLNEFVFEDDFATFSAAPILLSKDQYQATAMSFEGTWVP